MENEEMSFVTEVGVFGDLDIDDPTVIDAKKKKKASLESLIEAANEENLKNLTAIND